jgi:hypothetical protein
MLRNGVVGESLHEDVFAVEAPFTAPFRGAIQTCCLSPRAASAAADSPWAIFERSLRDLRAF